MIISEGLILPRISNTHLSLTIIILRRDPQEAVMVHGTIDHLFRGHLLMVVDMTTMAKEVGMQGMLRYLILTPPTCQVIMHQVHPWHLPLIIRQIIITPNLEAKIMPTLLLTLKLLHHLRIMDTGIRICNNLLTLDRAMAHNQVMHPSNSTTDHHMACHHRVLLLRVMPLLLRLSLLLMHLIKLRRQPLSLMLKICLRSSNTHTHRHLMVLHP